MLQVAEIFFFPPLRSVIECVTIFRGGTISAIGRYSAGSRFPHHLTHADGDVRALRRPRKIVIPGAPAIDPNPGDLQVAEKLSRILV
jgi:hypothetical protein